MIATSRFGRTGHASTRVIFGGNALKNLSQVTADELLETLREFGVNHIDTAARYGDSELRIAAWLRRHPGAFFVATKTAERTYAGAMESVRRSRLRLGVDRIDLLQLHHLVDPDDWNLAMGPGGALEAAIDARRDGLVRFIGVTGHGAQVAAMHLRSLARFPFDSVLLPHSHALLRNAAYRESFERLLERCAELDVAVQAIKWGARRRWPDELAGRRTWYEPLRDADAIGRALHHALRRPALFAITSADPTLLRTTLEAAARVDGGPGEDELVADAERFGIEPLFAPGLPDPAWGPAAR